MTPKLTNISEDALRSDGRAEPGTFSYVLEMFHHGAVASSRDYIRQNIGFLQDFDVNNTHYIIALLVDPRYTRRTYWWIKRGLS